jgi:hypothetical protein
MKHAGYRRLVQAAVVVTIQCLPVSRAAADPAATSPESAQALLLRGRELVERGEIEAGCQKLEASLAQSPAVVTRLHLADCYERTRRPATAYRAFQEVATQARAEGDTEREKIALEHMRKLEPRLTRIEVRVREENRVKGLAVEIGSLRLTESSWGVAVPVDPGEQTIRATAAGFRTHEIVIDVFGAGSTEVVEIPRLWPAPRHVEWKADPVLPAPDFTAEMPEDEPRTNDDRRSTLRTWGILVGGIGLTGVAAGAVLGVQAMTKNDASMVRCRGDDATLCNPRGVELRDRAFAYATGSTVALVAGGTLVAAGVIMFFAAPETERNRPLGLRPVVGTEVAAVELGGSW